MPEPLDLSGGKRDDDPVTGSDAAAPQPSEQSIPPQPEQVSGRLERLQQKLYSPNTQFQIRNRKRLEQKPSELQSDWEKESGSAFSETLGGKKRLTLFAKIAIMAFLFFAVSIGYAFYIFSKDTTGLVQDDVAITIIGPVAIGGGDELSLEVLVENNTSVELVTVDVVLEFPEGTKTPGNLRQDLPRIRDGVGDIAPGAVLRENYRAAIFGEEGDEKEINVRIEYSVPGSNAIYTREKTFTLALQSSPLRLAVDTVSELTSGQELVFNVTLASNSNQELKNVLLVARYPFGFRFSSADLETFDGNNTWFFDELNPEDVIEFQVRGVLEGQDNEERVFHFDAGIADDVVPEELGVVFTSLPKSVAILRPFLALDLSLDGSLEADLVRQGSTEIEGRLTFKNNTGATVKDAVIQLTLNGEVIADNRVEVGSGFYNSTDNTITWDKTTGDVFEEVAAGAEELLVFSFQTKPLATRNAVYKNPEIVIDATAKGNRLSESGVPQEVTNAAVKRIKIESDIDVETYVTYGQGPFQDRGPIPPIAEEETTYTITHQLSNSSNYVEGGKFVAQLPNYVRWNNQVSPASENVTFDEVNRRITWDLGDIQEHIGFIDPARKVSYQLTLIPSSSQVGQAPVLLQLPTFTGFDTFTQTTLQAESGAVNIDLGGSADLEDSRVQSPLR